MESILTFIFDSSDWRRLRKEHATAVGEEGRWMGVDVLNEGICDTFKSGVWEPAANKLNSLASATEAACVILRSLGIRFKKLIFECIFDGWKCSLS